MRREALRTMAKTEQQVTVAVNPKYNEMIRLDPRLMRELVRCATDFRHFLRYWNFVNQETGEVQILGEDLWPGQEEFVQTMKDNKKIYALKARKLGYTTLGIAFSGWTARFGPTNARVHVFSRREDAAQQIVRHVKFGLQRLPEWMALPMKPRNGKIEIIAGEHDLRIVQAYPADEETAVEETANHAHVDEWARMGNPKQVYQAIEPTMAGTAHIITTGRGPQNYSGQFWLKSMAGDTPFKSFFTNALARKGRDEAWLEAKKRGMDEISFRQEYAMTWEDALFAGGDFQFKRSDLDICSRGIGWQAAELGHDYSIAWDIGRHYDAAVGIVIDKTVVPRQVVDYVRLRGKPYPYIQKQIERQWAQYGGGSRSTLLVEKNGPGEAVLENLDLPERLIENAKFQTSQSSKARIINGLTVAFEHHELHYNKDQWPALDVELRGYQIPDDDVTQDSVMALAIADDGSRGPSGRGRVRRLIRF